MKKAICAVLSLLLVLILLPLGTLAAGTPRILVGSGTAAPGGTVQVEVSLENNPGINTFTLNLEFDTGALTFVKAEPSEHLTGNFQYSTKTNALVWQASQDTSFNGKALTLTFSVADTAQGDLGVGVSYKSGNICNYDEEDVDFTIVPGTISLKGAESQVLRIAGTDRHETAFKIADLLKRTMGIEGFDYMIIASGTDSADALAGSYLAARRAAPILLSRGNSHARNLAYIQENLAPGGLVYILGGSAAVPEEMEELLKANGIRCKRLKGATRFDTNLAILDEAGVDGTEILVSTGYNFADSLSASATGLPILLLHTRANVLTDSQKAWLAERQGVRFTIIGGTGAVSAELEAALAEYGTTVRLKGSGREATSVEVAQTYFGTPDTVLLAYSRNFPDGLCGGPLAYNLSAPLLLVNTKQEAAAAGYVNQKTIQSGYILGGTGVITDETARIVFGLDSSCEIPKQ